ncbi:MAG TPA: DMT family transporter [Anaerolineales bacterium]|nr:DMT family transporter [Anaerolineales bacterium]
MLGNLLALASAAVWGAGDFVGGRATQRTSPFQVLAVSASSGLLLLVLVALVWREPALTPREILFSALAGTCGALGIMALYRGLSEGHSASVAPTAAVISAALPVLYGILFNGLPTPLQLGGFVLALVGIALVSQTESAGQAHYWQGLGYAVIAGVGFGGFFICISQVSTEKVFLPLLVARAMAVLGALLLLALNRQAIPQPHLQPLAVLAGGLDVTANVLFVLAKQTTRLDIAVILSSLYPASTVLLSKFLLKERVSLVQWGGIGCALVAIGLISSA